MRRGRRSRARGGPGHGPSAFVIALLVVATVGAITTGPTTAFTTGTLGRVATATVADDATGLLGIDVAEQVDAGASSRLVTVTNHLDRQLTVAVSLDGTDASLSHARATLAPGDVVTTAVTVDCESPPDAVSVTIEATADTRFTGTATRSTAVDSTACARAESAFASVRVDDVTTPGRGGKAEYEVQYAVDTTRTTATRVAVEFDNQNRDTPVERVSTAQADRIRFRSGGQRIGEPYAITVRVFDDSGEIRATRIELTDTADGDGTVYERS